MATVPALTDRTHAQRWAEVRDEHALWGDLRPELLEAVRRILEATMEDELGALVRAARNERNHLRLDVRNGVYYRRLVTELGAITDLAVPRRRLVPYRPSFLRRAARRTSTIDTVLRQRFSGFLDDLCYIPSRICRLRSRRRRRSEEDDAEESAAA